MGWTSENQLTSIHSLRRVVLLLMLGMLCDASADEFPRPPAVSPNPLLVAAPAASADAVGIRIDRLEALLQPASLTRSSMRIQLSLSVTNLREQPIAVSASQLTLISGATSTVAQLGGAGEPFRQGDLDPGEQRSGAMTFAFLEYHPEEHPLVLKWTFGAEQVFVVLNDELRRLHHFEVERKGPGDRLAIVRASRDLDILAMWPLHDQLRSLQQQGVERIVLAPSYAAALPGNDETTSTRQSNQSNQSDQSDRAAERESIVPPPAPAEDVDAPGGTDTAVPTTGKAALTPVPEITEEALLWLSPLRSDIPADGMYAAIHSLELNPFIELQVAGFSNAQSRRFPSLRSSITLAESEMAAVIQAMQSCYDRLPVERAFADVFQSDPGLRTAALNACIDRLTTEQQVRLLTLVRHGDRSDQLSIVPVLSRISTDNVLRVLAELSRSPDADIALVALQSLMESGHPRTAETVGELWELADPLIRRTIISAAIRLNDYRWTELLSGHAVQLLEYFAGRISDPLFPEARLAPSVKVQPKPRGSDMTEAAPSPARLVHSAQHADTLRSLLRLLPAVEHPDVLDMARNTVLEIQDETVQDLAVSYVRQMNDETDRVLIESYLRRRLAAETISDAVADAAYRYPSPEWTEPFLKIYTEGKLNSPALRRKILGYALHAATPDQLESLIRQPPSTDVFLQVTLLKHLAGTGHPAWYEMAKSMLQADAPNTNAEAVDILAAEGSEPALMLLNERLLSLISAEIDFDQPREVSRRTLAERLITRLSVISHPEIARTLNRCLRHPSRTITEATMRVLSAAHRRSPGYSLIEEAVLLKRDRKYAEALAKATEATQADPFSAEALLYRASFLLRDDRLDEALADLSRANSLNPEEPSTLNTIALVMVRQGEVERGVQLAERTLQLDPLEDSNLYNTCCTLARASETPEMDQAARTTYRCRAVDLLLKTVAQGFNDLEHLQNDPDLNSLHSEPEWDVVVKQLQQRESVPAAPPP